MCWSDLLVRSESHRCRRYPVGVVAGTGEWVDAGGAQKAAHHVQQCAERCIPLLFLVHTPDPYARTAQHLARAGISKCLCFCFYVTHTRWNVCCILVDCTGTHEQCEIVFEERTMHALRVHVNVHTCTVEPCWFCMDRVGRMWKRLAPLKARHYELTRSSLRS